MDLYFVFPNIGASSFTNLSTRSSCAERCMSPWAPSTPCTKKKDSPIQHFCGIPMGDGQTCQPHPMTVRRVQKHKHSCLSQYTPMYFSFCVFNGDCLTSCAHYFRSTDIAIVLFFSQSFRHSFWRRDDFLDDSDSSYYSYTLGMPK